jgi:uncharacterized protein (TIGR00106 family)
MIAEFCIIPIGGGSHFSARLAKVLKIVDASGLDYKLGPMGTSVEGEWDEVMRLIKKCQQALLAESDRVWISIKVDSSKGTKKRLAHKVESVIEKAGKPLRT